MSALCYCFNEPEIIQTSSYIAEKVFLPIFFFKIQTKRTKMALKRSPEFKGVIVQIVYVEKIQFEPA